MPDAVWSHFGGDPVPVEVDVVRGVLGLLSETAEVASGIRSTLAGMSGGAAAGVWVGESADVFAEKLGELPALIQKVERSYGDAAVAVRIFVGAVAVTRSDADALTGRAWNALDGERASAAADAATPEGAAKVDSSQQAMRDVRALVDDLREDYRRAEANAVGALTQAKKVGIPPESAWHKFLRGVEDWAGVIAIVLLVIIVVALVVLVVIFTAGAGLGLFAALLLALQTLGPLLTALTVVSATKLAATATRKAQYNDSDTPSWTALGIDAALIVIPFGLGKGAAAIRAAKTGADASKYANLVRANRPFSWAKDINPALSRAEQSAARNAARQWGLIPRVPYKPGTNYPDFAKVINLPQNLRGVFSMFKNPIRSAENLPTNLWKSRDATQFRHLDNLLPGGRPPGTTWHHTEIPGRMELVPFGLHNSITHAGGRSAGMWAAGPR